MLLSSIDINCVGGLIFTLFKTDVYNATTGKVSLRKVRNRFWIIFVLSSLRPLVSPRFNNLFSSTSYGACKYITMSGFFTYIYISNPSMLYMLCLPLWSWCITHLRKFHLENHTLCDTIWPIIIIEPFLPRCKTPKLGFISFVNQIGWNSNFFLLGIFGNEGFADSNIFVLWIFGNEGSFSSPRQKKKKS